MTVPELYEKLNSPEFQDTKNGDLFYNFFIFQYNADEEYSMRQQIESFKQNLVRPATYVDALTLDLFNEFCQFLDSQSFGKKNPSLLLYLLEREVTNPEGIHKTLCHKAQSKEFMEYIHQRILSHIEQEDDGMKRPYVFVYGIGDMFPYLRTNVFLTNYESYNQTDRYKIIVFYPGHRVENSFSLFDCLDDAHTYRATLLLNAGEVNR